MPAVADEQVRAPLQGGTEIQCAIAPARRTDHVAQLGSDHGRPSAILREP